MFNVHFTCLKKGLSKSEQHSFVVVLLFIFVIDLEVPEFVITMRACDDTKPVSKVVLLQVLLGEVLEVPLGERSVSNHSHLVLHSLQGHLIQVVEFPFHLDATFKELLKVVHFHDAIFYWVSAIVVEGEGRLLLRFHWSHGY